MGQLLGTDASVPVVASYPSHPVTENFDLLTAFPLSQSVKGEAGMELGNANTQNVINTSDRSWSESDVKSLATGGKVSLDELSELTGINLEHEEVDTVGGWLYSEIQDPRIGKELHHLNMRFIIREIGKHRIKKVELNIEADDIDAQVVTTA